MKSGAELEIERKNNEWSKKIDGKYNNNPYSNYNQQGSNSGPTKSWSEIGNDIASIFDTRNEEQKKIDQHKKKQLEMEENEKEKDLRQKLYYENFPTLTSKVATLKRQVENDKKSVTNFIKSKNEFYGKTTEKIITSSWKYTLNNNEVTIKEYRSTTLPNKLNVETVLKGEDFKLELPVVGKVHYMSVTYSDEGKLVKLYVPNPVTLSKTSSGPVVIPYKGTLYPLPVTSGHYKDLTGLVEKNNGNVEVGNIDATEYEVMELGGESYCTIF